MSYRPWMFALVIAALTLATGLLITRIRHAYEDRAMRRSRRDGTLRPRGAIAER